MNSRTSAQQGLDVEFVRRQFPGLDEWALFENAGGTLVPRTVIDRAVAYLSETQVQPGAAFPASAKAAERIAESHRLLAEMINASPEEIVVGASSTMNMYVLSHALESWFEPGDELIVTNLDHEANNGAWRRLAARRGLILKEWRLDPESAELEASELERLLSARTRLVCFTQCSNITGSLHDAARFVRLAHEAGALACVDAVAFAPHRALDVRAIDADFYAFSLYKLYGPHLGLLYGKREHLLRAEAQNHFFVADDDIPLKLNPGGVNHELTAAAAGIAEYFDALHRHHFPGANVGLRERVAQVFELVAHHEERLARRFADFITGKPGVRLIGRATGERALRVPTFSFTVDGRDAAQIPEGVLADRVAIRSGDFYAARCIEALGLDERGGVVRASMVHYNSEDEVARLIEALDRVL